MASNAELQQLRAGWSTLTAWPPAAPGDATGEGASGEELTPASFVERAEVLQRCLASTRLRVESEGDAKGMEEELRAEVGALRSELAEKERLLARHREQLLRWNAACADVRTGCNEVSRHP